MQQHNPHAGQVTGAIFLIGMGLLFALGWFWPGILYLIGVTAIADGALTGKSLSGNLQGGLFMIGLGLVFTLGFSLPLLFIILGLITLFGISGKIPAMSQLGDANSEERQAQREQRREWKERRRAARRAYKETLRYGMPSYPDKLKNDRLYDESEPEEDEEPDTYRLGDDGELVKVKNDQRKSSSNQ